MKIDQIIQAMNSQLEKPLTPLQEQILRCAWDGETYADMAIALHYQEAYIKNIASQLWQELSKLYGDTIIKGNFRVRLEKQLTGSTEKLECDRFMPESSSQEGFITSSKQNKLDFLQAIAPNDLGKSGDPRAGIGVKTTTRSADRNFQNSANLDFPGSPIPLDSSSYIERPPVETLACQEIQKPGSVCSVMAPPKMGKSSLLIRMLHQAHQENYAVAMISFNAVDRSIFRNLDQFLRWLCANICHQLDLPNCIEESWDEVMGSKTNCTIYLQEQILEKLNRPFVLAFNEFHHLFDYLEVMQDFIALLRFWHEQSKREPIWENLRLVIVHSVKRFVTLDPNQSPFNVGLPLELQPFTVQQVQVLANYYGLENMELSSSGKAEQLIDLLGGHPYLISLAFHHLSCQQLSWISLLNLSPPAIAIYRNHLESQFRILEQDVPLLEVFKQVLAGNQGELNPLLITQLQSLGLVRIREKQVYPFCQLYHRYFSDRLFNSTDKILS